jgi:hypothetical protein
MSRIWSIYALARADVFERMRRYQYLATVAVTLLIGTLLVPARNAGYETFLIDGYRGIYNSAWIGASYALLTAVLLSLFAFYNVKSAVERDRTTRVGEIIATTSIGRFDYSLGKALSNFVVLGSMGVILCITAIVMQFVRGESYALHLEQIVIPFVLVVFPLMAMIAAIAVFFEMVPWLRGGFGNVIYFFAWTGYLVWSVESEARPEPWWRDMLGANLVMRQVWESLVRVDPRARPDSVDIGAQFGARAHHFFSFAGLHWSAADVLERLLWFAVALGIVAAAALLFDRFAKPAHSSARQRSNALAARWQSVAERYTAPVIDALCGNDFGSIVLAEFRLLVRGLSFWWYVVAASLWIVQLFADGASQSLLIGIAWIWPMLQWSQLGTRETVCATEQLVYPTLHPIRRQFLAQWFAGVLLALLTAGGSLAHWTVTGNLAGIEGVFAGAVFVPTLAIACGALSGTTRLFEILYLVLWYVGPMNRTTFDFTQGAYAPEFTLASFVLFAVAVSARKLRLQYA